MGSGGTYWGFTQTLTNKNSFSLQWAGPRRPSQWETGSGLSRCPVGSPRDSEQGALPHPREMDSSVLGGRTGRGGLLSIDPFVLGGFQAEWLLQDSAGALEP